MQKPFPLIWGLGLTLATIASGQTVLTWTSNSDNRWSRSQNWSGNNRPDNSNEIAQFGTGNQLNPELNANNLTVRGIRFSAGAGSYNVDDDNNARTLRIGNNTSSFVENLSANDQAINIATLQFQRDATIRTTGTGELAISSNLTGTNRDLTFNTVSDITVTGNITTGNGTLTKQGSADLHLSGTNTYTGTTSIDAGAIVLQDSDVFANSGRIDIAGGASLRLNDLSDTIGRLTGAGTVDFGSGGSLTLASGSSTYAGAFTGSGELVIGAGATLTLGTDFNNANLNLVLAGGTLQLAGYSLSLGALSVSADSVIDFGAGAADSHLAVASLGFDSAGLGLTVQNWADAADYFYSQTGYLQGSAPLDQVEFQGWDPADTKWMAYDSQITPVPEPRTYGAWLMVGMLSAGWCFRRRARPDPAGASALSDADK